MSLIETYLPFSLVAFFLISFLENILVFNTTDTKPETKLDVWKKL